MSINPRDGRAGIGRGITKKGQDLSLHLALTQVPAASLKQTAAAPTCELLRYGLHAAEMVLDLGDSEIDEIPRKFSDDLLQRIRMEAAP